MFMSDVRYGLRLLAHSPGFSLVAVLAVALGIGANTAIFSVVSAVLLHPLPYPDSGRLVMVWERSPQGVDRNTVSPANFLAWRERSRSLQQLAALHILPVNLTGEAGAEQVWALRASASLFPMLAMKPALGRGLAEGEDRPPGARVVVLSHSLWQRRFGGRSDVIGRTLVINQAAFTVVGVMPPGLELPSLLGANAELLVPLAFSETDMRRGARFLAVMGRIGAGFGPEAARAEMQAVAGQLARDFPERDGGWGINLVPLNEQLVGEVRPAILVLLGAVGCVLLIACANVANLLLTRAAGRKKEIAIRAALGAGKCQLVRQLLIESMLLAFAGGGVGLLLAVGAVRVLAQAGKIVGVQRVHNTAVDPAVLAFTLILSLATGILFGLAPAISSVRADLIATLKSGGRGSGAAAGKRMRNYLVMAEIALALVLLVAAGLMLRTFAGLRSVDRGFRPERVLTMRVMLAPIKYQQPEQRLAFYRDAVDRFASLPGVEAAAAINFLPLTGVRSSGYYSVPGEAEAPPDARPIADVRVVTPGYFGAMGIPLTAGRAFDERDGPDAPHVFIAGESLARRLWPGQDPLGRTLRLDATNHVARIVGVVRDVRHRGLHEEPEPAIYMPLAQNPLPFASFALRTSGDPMLTVAAARREIAAIDPDQPVSDVQTMEAIVSASTARTRFSTALLAVFALAAAVLATLGIYGVVSYSVAQQTQEFGVRVAMGAQAADLVRQVLKQALLLAAGGIAIGWVAGLAVTRAMSSLLFGVKPADPATFVAVAALLMAVALASSYGPCPKSRQGGSLGGAAGRVIGSEGSVQPCPAPRSARRPDPVRAYPVPASAVALELGDVL